MKTLFSATSIDTHHSPIAESKYAASTFLKA
jgi:hypothetical protein